MTHAELRSKPLGVLPKSAPGWQHVRLRSPSGSRKIGNAAFVSFSHAHSRVLRVSRQAADFSETEKAPVLPKRGLMLELRFHRATRPRWILTPCPGDGECPSGQEEVRSFPLGSPDGRPPSPRQRLHPPPRAVCPLCVSFPFSGHVARHSRDCAPESPISHSCLAPSIAACAARPVTPGCPGRVSPGNVSGPASADNPNRGTWRGPNPLRDWAVQPFQKPTFAASNAISRDLDPPTFYGIVLTERGLRSRWYPENAGPFSVPGEGRTFRRAAARPYASSTRPGVAGVGGAVFGLRCRVWRGPPEGLWPVQYPVPGTTPKILAWEERMDSPLSRCILSIPTFAQPTLRAHIHKMRPRIHSQMAFTRQGQSGVPARVAG